MEKARKFKDLFKAPGLIRLVGAHNGMCAKLIGKAGGINHLDALIYPVDHVFD